MAKAALNLRAPDFVLEDFQGAIVRLSDFAGKSHVILVLNRGFT